MHASRTPLAQSPWATGRSPVRFENPGIGAKLRGPNRADFTRWILFLSTSDRRTSQLPVQPLTQRPAVHRPGDAGKLPACAKQNQGRDTANPQAPGQPLVLLGVELGHPQPGLAGPGRLLQNRRHHMAGRAPGRPEVHQNREIAASHLPLEAFLVQAGGHPLEEARPASAALRALAQASPGEPVDAAAIGTDHKH